MARGPGVPSQPQIAAASACTRLGMQLSIRGRRGATPAAGSPSVHVLAVLAGGPLAGPPGQLASLSSACTASRTTTPDQPAVVFRRRCCCLLVTVVISPHNSLSAGAGQRTRTAHGHGWGPGAWPHGPGPAVASVVQRLYLHLLSSAVLVVSSCNFYFTFFLASTQIAIFVHSIYAFCLEHSR